jgi:Bacteriophage T4-like portal protein (Gp20)
MSWRKHFRIVTDGSMSPVNGSTSNYSFGYLDSQANAAFRNYQSMLPDIYSGHPNRIDRYTQYENMDLDSEVNSSLDILAEFCTQINDDTRTSFQIHFNDEATLNEIEILKEQLISWYRLNDFDKKIFKIFRNALKYGDQVFVRDPETYKWYWSEMNRVSKIIVNESQGKVPEVYYIRDIQPNLQNDTITRPPGPNDTYAFAPYMGGSRTYTAGGELYSPNTRFAAGNNEFPVKGEHVIHLSLTEGLDVNWPFGVSILEGIFKVFKQKELLEDALLIYRVQRAPERRVFKIDVGNMPAHLQMSFLERVKNEIHQRRIPTQSGGGQNLMDASYNPLCLDLSTRIPLLDGRTLALSELIAEFESGKENWAYSCDPSTGKVVPGLINWAGVTRKNTEVIKLTFDNGETLICTPDHKIPVFGKGFIEAQHLTENDSLIAFNIRNKEISSNGNEYQQVWDHESKKWIWTHRLVGEFFRSRSKHQEFTYLEENALKEKSVIHHKDYNRFNNDPRNLAYMNKEDHILFHSAQKESFWENMTDDYRYNITNKISETLKSNWKHLTKEQRLSRLWNIRQAQKKSVWLRQNDPISAENYKKKMSSARKEYFEKNPLFLEQCRENMSNRIKIKNQELIFTFDMLQIIADFVKQGYTNKNEVLSLCDKSNKLLKLVEKNNSTPLNYKNAQCKIDFTKFGYSKLDRLINKFGYKNWKTFVKNIENFNHRIIKIEKVSNRDTGTITIDGNEKWHDFHTFAIESGIFVKNSINEDYFFPQSADGRGSSVEVLPGGQNLGEIDDLRYFQNKLFRGLRIPSSYLPTGKDDSDRAYTDGKVTTALIQEFRFNEYCKRLQKLIGGKFDEEFKLFLKWRGFSLDNSLFELRFNEPQNFASYREIELNGQRITSFTGIRDTEFLSKRFMLKKYLGLNELEMAENEKLWHEEKGTNQPQQPSGADMRSVGITPGGITGDLDTIGELGAEAEAGGPPVEPGTETGPPGGPGGAPAPTAPQPPGADSNLAV